MPYNRLLQLSSRPPTKDDFFFVSHIFWVDKFNIIKIIFVTYTVDLVGQGRLTTAVKLTVPLYLHFMCLSLFY